MFMLDAAGSPCTVVDAAAAPQGCGSEENDREELPFRTSLFATFTPYTSSSSAARPRGSRVQMPQLRPAVPLAQSPLVDRRQPDRSLPGLTSPTVVSRCTPSSATAQGVFHVEASPPPGPASTFPTASPAVQELNSFGRWLSAEKSLISFFVAPSADSVGGQERRGGDVVCGSASCVRSPIAIVGSRTPVSSPLHQVASSSLPPLSPLRGTAAPPMAFPTTPLLHAPTPSSWRAWRLALSLFCLLNGALAFLFAWMMRTEQISFAVAAARRRWDLNERAAATRRAGFYYALLGLILLVDRTMVLVCVAVRFAGRGVRAGFSSGRRLTRLCRGRVAALPFCAPLLRRCTRRIDDTEAALLSPPPQPPPRLDAAAEAKASSLCGLSASALCDRRGSPEVEAKWKSPVPLKIRRRGN
ncbi:hypothetical protein ABB37_03407 [Leptomonas pyrrhocoris]|uniref:Transmembrane protein n=1 Tax=Leptomonas pyrrhocoris TaxID=157538 RepID=A0A0N0DWX8_LEPPY|nr:hypothetical protein ABB37_03407 [Leptomonas pyrrhocoris]KPA82311.1 hypothetical protein ABB37_03407 [Leptomonas pyrrhocoris]|eukprot:XP_015660750.1 hypothetical protein ABB37_03407 [Leptomonas pyrrhocoris]